LGDGKSLREYAFLKHVVPVSPNSFYAYLHTILLGLRGMKVEESAREIIHHLAGLRGRLARFQEEFRKLGRHVEQAKGSFDSTQRQLERLSDKLNSLETPSLLLPSEEPPEQEQNALSPGQGACVKE